jgi:hypothetical protein
MQEITTHLVKTLAAANGIRIPEERLEVVRAQYETFLETLAEIDGVTLAREAEPAILFSLVPPAPAHREGGK